MRREEFEQKYLNKNVEIIFFDNNLITGMLEKDKPQIYPNDLPNCYHIGSLHFRKSHIKKIIIKEVSLWDIRIN